MTTAELTNGKAFAPVVIPKIYSPKPRKISSNNARVEREFCIHQPVSKSLSNNFKKEKNMNSIDINKFSVEEIENDFSKMKHMSTQSDIDTEEEIFSILESSSGIYSMPFEDENYFFNQSEQIERVHNPIYKCFID